MVIGRCQRSDDVVEPRLKTQWFMNGPMAERRWRRRAPAGPGSCPSASRRFFDWMENIRDWNVSRQLWWGHRIPAWYCPDGHITVSALDGPTPARLRPPAGELQQDPDIFDTWFSRACGRSRRSAGPRTRPTAALLPDVGDGDRLRHHLLLGRADDDARASGDGALPHGLPVRADPRPGGPQDVQDQGQRHRPAGGDRRDRRRRAALRADPRRDARQRPASRPTKLEDARNFANKLWNATRFVVGRAAGDDPGRRRACSNPDERHLGPAERWIAARGRGDGPGGRRGDGRLRLRRGDPGCSTTRSGASTATGGSSSRRSASPTRPWSARDARRPGGRWSSRSTRTCACSTRSCRS